MVTCMMKSSTLCVAIILVVALTCSLTLILTQFLNKGKVKVVTNATVASYLILVISLAVLAMTFAFIYGEYKTIIAYKGINLTRFSSAHNDDVILCQPET